MVFYVKNLDTEATTYKERIVAQLYRYYEMNFIVLEFSTVRPKSLRLILQRAAQLNFILSKSDIALAPKRRDNLNREVKMAQPQLIIGPEEQILRIFCPLYGLADDGDYCHQTIDDNLIS